VSKTKLLLDVVEDLRSLADSLQSLCNACNPPLEDINQTSTDDAEVSAQEPSISFEALRARLGEISRAGFTAGVHDLIQKYGATHLSKVAPKDYDSLLKEAEALINAT